MQRLIVFILCGWIGMGIGWWWLGRDSQLNLLVPVGTSLVTSKFQTLGFLPFWLVSDFNAESTSMLNRIAYFSLPLAADGTIAKLANPREENPGWTTLKRFKVKPSSKQDLSLTIFSGDEEVIYALLSDPIVSARNLVADVAPIMRDYGFTDLNLDIESINPASATAQLKFTQYVQALKSELTRSQLGSLTVELQPSALFQTYLTDPVAIGQIADYVVIMTYDFHYPGSILAGPVAPLGGAGTERVWDVTLSAKAAASLIPAHKLLLGIPVYGYEWQTLDESPGSPVIPGTGVFASDARVAKLDFSHQLDVVASEPYVIFPENDYFHQIYFSNAAAVAAKVKLAHQLHLGGVAFWALGYEASSDLSPLPDL